MGKGLIHLENLEYEQNEWRRGRGHCAAQVTFPKAEGDGRPPLLNSPRSLRACEICGIDPTTAFEPVSLQEEFDLVNLDTSVASQTPTSVAAARDALLACIRAGITAGSTQAKLKAYQRFKQREEERAAILKRAQITRRRLIAEEILERGQTAAAVRRTFPDTYRRNSSEVDIGEAAPLKCFNSRKPARSFRRFLRSDDFIIDGRKTYGGAGLNRFLLDARDASGSVNEVVLATRSGGATGSLSDVGVSTSSVATVGKEASENDSQRSVSARPVATGDRSEVFFWYCANAVAAGNMT
ncbi:hypothetical protein ERJ75_000702500 [Trypanosoma vivax]|nr:hypothetical protein ERJ75_000702500 [Trypanosoma vivax]